MKIVAIIQARMGSSRLEGKMLFEIAGRKIIDHVIQRVKKSKLVTDVIVATSIAENNLPLVEHISSQGERVFIGSEDDVLDRFYQLAKLIEPDIVVRVTGDCPMLDPDVIDKTIRKYLDSKCDYCSNCIVGGKVYPDGMDVEVFSFNALKVATIEARKPSEREHVTPYIRESGNFKVASLEAPEDYSEVRITLDEQRDFDTLCEIFKKLNDKENYTLSDVIEILNHNPEIAAINSGIIRNEGYLKSIEND